MTSATEHISIPHTSARPPLIDGDCTIILDSGFLCVSTGGLASISLGSKITW